MKIIANKIWLVLLFICFYSLNASDIGSDFTIQSHIIFNYGEDNRIANDAVMENGFTLTARTPAISDSVATCSFDSYFPVQGLTNLNGGYLTLNNNIDVKDIASWGSAGKVFGNGFSITFPASNDIVGVPSSVDRSGRLRQLEVVNTPGSVIGLDWSFDNKYLAIAKVAAAGNEIRIYSWDGVNLSEVAGINSANNLVSVHWHPSKYYFAYSENTTTFYVYKFTPPGTVTQIYSENLGSAARSSVWSYDGKYIAVATGDETLRAYSFDESTESVTEVASTTWPSGAIIAANDSLSWNRFGDEIALGWGSSAVDTELYIFDFDGTSLSLTLSYHIPDATRVFTVSWLKKSTHSDLIAASIGGSLDNFRIYSYINNTLTELASNGSSNDFLSCDWDDDGYRVLAGDGSSTFYVYYYNPNTQSLFLIDSDTISGNINTSGVSSNSKYLATASTLGDLRIYGFQQNYMLFDNTNLVFNSDSEFIVTTTFSGLCTINGNGHKVYLNEDGSFNIAAQSQLKLQNLELVNLKQNNLQCLADDSQIIFEDCILTITSNYVFDTGSILFLGDVEISGTSKFTYSSSSGSTIDSFSTLKINPSSTFSYSPSVSNRDLIYMNDDTSSLYLDNCTINSTTTGLRLTRGKLFIQNLVTLNSDGSALSESICFGNGTADDDLDINILAHADLEVYGTLEYKNTN